MALPVLLLATGGCGSGDEEPPAAEFVAATPVTVDTTAGTAPEPVRKAPPVRAAEPQKQQKPPPALDPAAFVRVVQASVPELAVDRRDEEIAAVAEQSCSSLAAGQDADTLVTETRNTAAVDRATARELIKLSIGTVCPAQQKRAREF